jgi:dephospho-CoA kinase
MSEHAGPRTPDFAAHRAMPIIGLAGGIGSGKSEVGRILAELGCVVSDSDAAARAMLDEPGVRDQLVAWWGPGVLDAQGRIDRSAVARVVFEQPGERAKLEGLVHPRLKAARHAQIAAARDAGAKAFVIDAPLLFEAGLAGGCRAIIFVDTPREERLARVRASRGWDEHELARREAAQWPLDRKRRESSHTVRNHHDRAALREAVRQALADILARA